MKNPLRKRIPRELKGEFGKYLVVFILMVTTIGMVSGFLVADGSMIQAYNEGFEKYNIEDGNFRTGERLYRGQREAIEEKGVKVYENYYIEDTLTNGSTMRFFKNRTDVNKVCLMDGKLAEKTGEIAIDRMYADNKPCNPQHLLMGQGSFRTADEAADGALGAADLLGKLWLADVVFFHQVRKTDVGWCGQIFLCHVVGPPF